MTNLYIYIFLLAGLSLCVMATVSREMRFIRRANRFFLPNKCDASSGWCLSEVSRVGEVGWWEPSGGRLSPVRAAKYDIRRMSLPLGRDYYPDELLEIKRMKSCHHLRSATDREQVNQNPVERILMSSRTAILP